MDIVYHSTNTFAAVLGTSIASLLENNLQEEEIHIYVIEHGISQDNQERLTRLASRYRRTISFIPMPDVNKEENLNLKYVKSEWLFDSFCRLFLHKYLPKCVERVLYLDSDVLVTDSLSELWNFDLHGKCIGAVIEGFSKNYYALFDLDERAAFYNSGVLLMDLNRWEKAEVDARVRSYIKRHDGYVMFMEMGVLNAVLQDEIVTLPACYNVRTEMLTLSYKEAKTLRKPVKWYSEEEILAAVKYPAIIHLTNLWLISNRAWYAVTNHPAKELYAQYKNLTEWRDEPGKSDTRSTVRKLSQVLMDHTPRALLIPAVSFVYNYPRIWKIRREMKKRIGRRKE